MNAHRRRRRLLLLSGIAAVALGSPASIALAQDPGGEGKLRTGEIVVVRPGETVEGDLYASGGTVRIEGTVRGDAVLAAGEVLISGEVTGDAVVVAGIADISGRVGGDARLAVGEATVRGSVGEDALAAGGGFTLDANGRVGEDVVVATGSATLDGHVAGDVVGGAGSYARRGSVGGMEDVRVDRIPEAPPTLAGRLVGGLRRLVSLLAVAALLLWLAPRAVDAGAQELRRRPLASLGAGIATPLALVVLVPVLIVVGILVAAAAALAGLGDLAGFVVLAVVALLIVVASLVYAVLAFAVHVVAALALDRTWSRREGTGRRWTGILAGLIVVVALTSLPAVGGWLALIITLLGLGALVLAVRARRRHRAPADDGIAPDAAGVAPDAGVPPPIPPPP